LALRVGLVGLRGNGIAGYGGLRGPHGLRGPPVVQLLGAAEDGCFHECPFRNALNNQLRTGADKGNPTV
jgi:hypothetical protein